MSSSYGFATLQEREDERKQKEVAEDSLRDKRKEISDATVVRIGPIVRDSLTEFCHSMGLNTMDYTGKDQAALIEEEPSIQGHTWRASSWKKTGTHSDYRPDGVHVLDEHTAYTITVSLLVDKAGVPLLYIGDYVASKLVGKIPVVASNFAMEIPSRLAATLQNKTGIKQVKQAEYLAARSD